jgi:CO dehydrogenase/acetyl-CoA synthase beta subunit
VRTKKRVVKRKTDMRKVTVSIPEELYYHIKQAAKNEIRTISQQARLFLEIGVEVVSQQEHEHEEDQEPPEKESCIGFQIDRGDDDE